MGCVWFYVELFILHRGQGLTPIVPHCSGSGPGPCPATGHSQCDYTIMFTLSSDGDNKKSLSLRVNVP